MSIAKVAGGKDAKDGADLLSNSTNLAKCVLSLPMHTELTEEQLNYICKGIKAFYR
jgi:dTDP-4-amino-4,6-dideoxygalactose transaminase